MTSLPTADAVLGQYAWLEAQLRARAIRDEDGEEEEEKKKTATPAAVPSGTGCQLYAAYIAAATPAVHEKLAALTFSADALCVLLRVCEMKARALPHVFDVFASHVPYSLRHADAVSVNVPWLYSVHAYALAFALSSDAEMARAHALTVEHTPAFFSALLYEAHHRRPSALDTLLYMITARAYDTERGRPVTAQSIGLRALDAAARLKHPIVDAFATRVRAASGECMWAHTLSVDGESQAFTLAPGGPLCALVDGLASQAAPDVSDLAYDEDNVRAMLAHAPDDVDAITATLLASVRNGIADVHFVERVHTWLGGDDKKAVSMRAAVAARYEREANRAYTDADARMKIAIVCAFVAHTPARLARQRVEVTATSTSRTHVDPVFAAYSRVANRFLLSTPCSRDDLMHTAFNATMARNGA